MFLLKPAPKFRFIRMALVAALCCAGSGFSPTAAFAYMDVMTTGELLDPGQFRAMVEPQLLFHKIDGGEIITRLDAGLTDSTNLRVLLGTGVIDFQTGVFLKWVPIPDYGSQPAVGIDTGVTYVRYDGLPETSLRLHPFLSKRLEAESGVWTPYGALPVAIAARDGKSEVPVALALGSQYQSNEWRNLQFMGEVGINLNKSYSYISAAAIFYFDENSGFKLK